MIKIDELKIFEEIRQHKPKKICLSAPDGLMIYLEDIASRITKEFNIDVFIMGDTCYGSCDSTNFEAKRIGAELAFNIGHTISFEKLGDRTIMIDAFDNISFDEAIENSMDVLKQFKKIGIVTFSQYLHQLESIKRKFEENGVNVIVGKGGGQLRDGQVFGCEFYPAFYIRDEVDAFVVLGNSNFHGIGVSLSSGKPTFMIDPYSKEILDLEEISKDREKKAILSISKARYAEKFGLILGLKEGQFDTKKLLKIKKRLEEKGKTVQLIAMREVTNERMAYFKSIEAFIQMSCPRVSIDGYTFNRPVLSAPQAEALLDLLDGKELDDFLVKPHWL
jgi:2-(3-amino-3-carboxypropyl)histidine synthase|tara:strand:+ start:2825 stop:3826 length:1002 start_codon:yes stop_codon:yes gene_type:complete